MGYRSNVTVVIYAPRHSTTPYALIKLWFDENYPHAEATTEWGAEINYDEANRAVHIIYDGVKWYDTYEHPQAVDKAFGDIDTILDVQANSVTPDKPDPSSDTIPFDIAWEFVRIGEEDNDNEIRMSDNADYTTTLHRYTSVNF